jgi:hypothetical protein
MLLARRAAVDSRDPELRLSCTLIPDIFKQSKLLSTTGKPYKRLAGKTLKFPAALASLSWDLTNDCDNLCA